MKRYLAGLIAVATLSGSVAAFAGAVSAGAAVKRGTTIRLERTSRGMILTANNGFTLYQFSRDSRNKDNCVRSQECRSVWPPVTTKARPVATKGVNAKLLGMIKLPGGALQVTYAGRPLYRYSGDIGPRQTDYIGITASGGTWYAVDARGRRVQ